MIKISACMIVKNEEEHIRKCLSSIRDKVDEVIVVDTGSTDGTIEIALASGARVFQFEWENDFSAARNYSLDQATGDWILILDADEELQTPEGKHLREYLQPFNADACILKLNNLLGTTESPSDISSVNVMRVFKNIPENRFEGKVHEQILFHGRMAILKELPHVEIIHYGYLEEIREGKKKFERNVTLLKKELELNPNDGYHWFNLGMEYRVVCNTKQALACFQKSYELSNEKDVFYSRLLRNLAICHLEEESYIEGIKICKKALGIYPDYTDIWYIMALFFKKEQKFTEAIELLQQALKLGDTSKYWTEQGTGSYRAIFTLGEIFLEMNRIDQSIGIFELGVTNYPHVFAFYPQLSELYISRSELRKAADILEKGSIHHAQLLPAVQRAREIVLKLHNK